MTRYTDYATDQYMRSVLADELSVDEADNALTALTSLTSAYPKLFPFERTFVRPDHQTGVRGAAGVRFVVYGEDGVERFLRLPRAALVSLKESIDQVFDLLRQYILGVGNA
jgi:hypothetical protein